MTEKRLAHANSPKHHAGGVGLSEAEYADISRMIANPGLVVWDKKGVIIYFNQERTVKILVEASAKDKIKPKEKLDAVINAYRLNDYKPVLAEINGGNYVVLQGKP